ncbi:MAG: LLM class flavin-dependent oxidoreductase [Chloroflexi bacterium]|nr:LLM class flavin-dependent oxidoreductase [Chloroflexota bacterium]
MPLRFGIASGIPDLPGKTHAELYRDTITMVEAAEDLGFDTCWFTEHHFSRHGVDSAVLTMMAGLARHTRRIRLGTAVSVLPFWNPVRLAEEVAVVDILSDGRFEFGVGSGYRVHEFTGLGVDPDLRTPLFLEGLAVLEQVWSGEPFTHQGEFNQIECRGLRPLPVQRPHPPLWVAAQSEAGVRWAGEHGAGWMFAILPGQTLEHHRPARDLYLESVAPTGTTPRVYFQIQACVADRPTAQVRAEAEPWVRWWFEAVNLGETVFNRGQNTPLIPQNALDHFFEKGFHGSPDHVLRQIEEYARFGITDFSFQVAFGPPIDRILETLETLAKHVLPEARRFTPVATK